MIKAIVSKFKSLRVKTLSLLISPCELSVVSERLNKKIWKQRFKSLGLHKVDEIFTYTYEQELRTLYQIASSLPAGAKALEIGSHLGASSCYICAGLDDNNGSLYCVDTWQNETMIEGEQDTFKEFQKNTDGIKNRIVPIRKRSDTLSALDLKLPLDFVFIDGDHSYAAVKKDFEMVSKWIHPTGVIAFHDFGNPDYPGVTRVVGEALESGHWSLAGLVKTLAWIKPAKWNKPTWVKEV